MVDLAAATDCGIMVANVPDYCVEEVSTHTIAFLLMLNRHIPFRGDERSDRRSSCITTSTSP
jgi:lactate dehydrogenase-like 2-hydroxyacid dehydrogenase